MSEPLDELYLIWLYSQVADPEVVDPNRTYWKVLRKLYSTEFAWFIPHDDNRVEDGKELRREFIHDQEIESVDPEWISLGCSALELMVGLSRHLGFETDGEPHYWFWVLMENIGLLKYNDRYRFTGKTMRKIEEILDCVIWRTYSPSGEGGFFPLREPRNDQRNVELWYQLSAYVLERT